MEVFMVHDEKGKIKIRFFEIELDGSNETLQEAMRTFNSVVGKSTIVINRTPALPGIQNHDASEIQQVEDEAAPPTPDEFTEPPSGMTPNSPTKPKKKKYATPQVLSIDLKSGKIPFDEYVQLKTPTDTTKKYLVCAAWLKENLNLDEITINHVYTCFRALGWNVQRDVGQTFRTGKKQGYFDNGSKNGFWKINHIGLGVVDKMGSKP
jgi:hypothetical protein